MCEINCLHCIEKSYSSIPNLYITLQFQNSSYASFPKLLSYSSIPKLVSYSSVRKLVYAVCYMSYTYDINSSFIIEFQI
jgi:hypothetical protein